MSDRQTQPGARQSVAGLLSSRSNLKHLWEDFLDLVFPPRCSGCDRVDTRWCSLCNDQLAVVPLDLTTRSDQDNIPIASTGRHTDRLQRAVQGLKYESATAISQVLGQRLVKGLSLLNWPIQMVVPVPLHANRLKTRGYNQAQLLAEEVSAALSIPCIPEAIERVRDTRQQVGLNQEQRQQNVIQAFAADPTQVAGKTVLVIDDVCTTGATLTECARAALNAGADAVYGVTVTTATS